MLLHITSLALAAFSGTTPAAPAVAGRAPQVVVADSEVVIALSADQLKNYIALKKEVTAFFADAKNAELKKTAEATKLNFTFQAGNQTLKYGAYDYPKLVKQSTELAAIFTKNHFAPEQYEPTQKAVITALASSAWVDASKSDPNSTPNTVKNVALVKPEKATLATLGMTVKLVSSGPGGFSTGSKDDDDDDQ